VRPRAAPRLEQRARAPPGRWLPYSDETLTPSAASTFSIAALLVVQVAPQHDRLVGERTVGPARAATSSRPSRRAGRGCRASRAPRRRRRAPRPCTRRSCPSRSSPASRWSLGSSCQCTAQLGQRVARVVGVRRAEVRRLRDEQGPARDPQPELRSLCGCSVRLSAFSESRLKNRVLAWEISITSRNCRVGEQLLVVVRRGRRGRDEPVPDARVVALVEQLAEGLAPAHAAQAVGLVERHAVEQREVQLPLADRLVVGEVVAGPADLVGPLHELQHDPELCRVVLELLQHAERGDLEEPPAGVRADLAPELELLERLAGAEALEERGAPEPQRPRDRRALEGEEYSAQRRLRREAARGRLDLLRHDEVVVGALDDRAATTARHVHLRILQLGSLSAATRSGVSVFTRSWRADSNASGGCPHFAHGSVNTLGMGRRFPSASTHAGSSAGS
jgi:hypothetical protein